jgi:hypothetical protein
MYKRAVNISPVLSGGGAECPYPTVSEGGTLRMFSPPATIGRTTVRADDYIKNLLAFVYIQSTKKDNKYERTAPGGIEYSPPSIPRSGS